MRHFGVIFSLFLSISWAQIDYEETFVRVEGESLSVSMPRRESVSIPCSFELEDVDGGITMNPENNEPDHYAPDNRRGPEWTYNWYGTVDEDCGLVIHQLDRRDHGYLKASIDGETFTWFNITVYVRPTSVVMEPTNTNRLNAEYFPDGSGETPNVTCIIREARPAPIVTWTIGDGIEPLNVTTLYEYTANEDEEREDGLIFYSVLTYQPRPSHDNQLLICEADHATFEDYPPTDGENRDSKNVTVEAPPDELDFEILNGGEPKVGDDFTLGVTFTSNPEPTALVWILPGSAGNLSAIDDDDNTISKVATSGRYSTSCTATGSIYRCTVTIKEVEKDDMGDVFTLMAVNRLGETAYPVYMPDIDTGLEGWAIALIVIAVLVLIGLLAVAAFVLYKKRKEKKKMRTRVEVARQQQYDNVGAD